MDEHGNKTPIGRRLIDALALKDVNVRGHTLRMEGAHRDAWITAWMERAERELSPTLAHLYGDLLEHPELPPGLRAVIEQGVNPTHQVDFILNVILTVAGVGANLAAITAPFVQKAVNDAWVRHPVRPLTPEELAVAVVKGQRDFATAYDEAAKNGISEPDFETLVNATGNPPGVESLLFMWRRGIIDSARLLEGIEQSNLKVEWAGELERLAYGPPSAQAALLGAVQGHIDGATAQDIVRQNGIDPANYAWLYQNTGRPPGPMQMVDLWNRGVIDQATVEQSIRESDVKDKYIPAFLGLREHLLPQKTVVAGVHQGVIPDNVALGLLLKLGISPTNAGYLIQEGHNSKVATHRALTVSMITDAYENGSITRTDAAARLVAMNYLAADAEFILDGVDLKWELALHSATVTRIRTLYLGHHIDRNTASSDLDKVGVTPAHRDLFLQLWDLTRTTPSRTLTEAQAASAYKAKLITEAQFRARLVAMGYDTVDIDLLVLMNPVATAPAARR